MLDSEAAPAGQPINNSLRYESKEQLEIADHVQQLYEADFIQAIIRTNHLGIPSAYVVLRITSRGHDFLENARNDTVWKKVVGGIKSKGITVSVEILESLLKGAMKQHLGLPNA